jgi:hypothetical protein
MTYCKNPFIMLQGIERYVLGVWIAHGEGLHFVTVVVDVETLITIYRTTQPHSLGNDVNLHCCETLRFHVNILQICVFYKVYQ